MEWDQKTEGKGGERSREERGWDERESKEDMGIPIKANGNKGG